MIARPGWYDEQRHVRAQSCQGVRRAPHRPVTSGNADERNRFITDHALLDSIGQFARLYGLDLVTREERGQVLDADRPRTCRRVGEDPPSCPQGSDPPAAAVADTADQQQDEKDDQ
jgi:hypothetical protein